MRTYPGISLIVSTYNWPQALDLCLKSIKDQTLLPDEIIIADDGSTLETRALIEKHQEDFPVPLIHIWQEDNGFQLSRIRNKAIVKTTTEYIIQIDGDLILGRHFIQDHINFIKPQSFVSGTRVQMSQELSLKLITDQSTNVRLTSKGLTNLSNALRVPVLSHFLANKYKAGDPTSVRGCNMAFWKSDLLCVNGYDESISGWGREDSELAIRLINAGIKKRMLKFGAVAFHIYHNEAERNRLHANDAILEKSINKGTKVCEIGLSQYL